MEEAKKVLMTMTIEYFQGRGGETVAEIRDRIDDLKIPPCRLFSFLRGKQKVHASLWELLWETRKAAWDYTWFRWNAQALTVWENARWELCWTLWGMVREGE